MKISGWQWGIGVVAVVTLAGVGVVVWQGRSGGASPKPFWLRPPQGTVGLTLRSMTRASSVRVSQPQPGT